MPIKKIISGGQTGADQGALDMAIKLGIPHGGWIPKGRLTETGPLSSIYQLKETAGTGYAKRTEQNVLDSDGTLLFSHGPLTGGSELTRDLAMQHLKPWLHIDIDLTAGFEATLAINEWLSINEIAILNVAGPRASKDPLIYRDTMDVLEAVYYLSLMEFTHEDHENAVSFDDQDDAAPPPATIDAAVDGLATILSLKDRVHIANMTIQELSLLDGSIGEYIRNRFQLRERNAPLLETCRFFAKKPTLSVEGASSLIIVELWRHLRATHTLRRVK